MVWGRLWYDYIGLQSDLIFSNTLNWKPYFTIFTDWFLWIFIAYSLINIASCMKSFIIKIEWKFIESFNKIISSVINK